MNYPITTQRQIREQFWADHPGFDHQAREAGIRSQPHNKQCATVRCAFGAYVDYLQRDGQISESLAQRATL